ncbi:23S rRNA (uracil(1939)-C(5))-methyltransferase RlmD [Pseudomonas oryzihabitans]|uniref:23S rRNA (uracil(1939)-C(5))-methyltransferase RlmD n=1 Tax=Pseudomonas oryzihabitans TaxID=47885 RepID=UPI002895C70B|nr:23S rRNA (uracil(1939)-C(5))-methyltransferase RlmD [Pseudomonas oryzihabitans]MDT3718032.1 23S rRNA (uracil(1939)-C(5))-methyltransferase RlmD [Pseudomonas oryzihabitans]
MTRAKRGGGGLRFQPAGGARSATVPTGKRQVLGIDRLSNDGRGIGHEGGRTWFVAGALPGERIEARVLGARSQVVEARTLKVLEASPLRRMPPCSVADRCGGCTLQHLPHGDQLALKQQALAEQFQRLAGTQPQAWAAPLVGPEFGYRRRARVAVRWDERQGRLEVGFRAEASQDIVTPDDCLVLVPELQRLLRALPTLLGGLERPQVIGHVELFQGTATALLVRHTQALLPGDQARLRDFCAAGQVQLWWQGKGEPMADQADVPLGYQLADWALTLAYRPGDFVQVNAPINAAMIAQALDWLAPGADDRVLDLFCGLGNFSLPLARQAAAVTGIEGVAAMTSRAIQNARDNGIGNAHFLQVDLSNPLPTEVGAHSLALLDPPRDGALEVVRQLKGLEVRRLVYVSCNPSTLARDAGELVRQGYRMTRAGILDMFPQTAHVEAMVLFEAGGMPG